MMDDDGHSRQPTTTLAMASVAVRRCTRGARTRQR